MSAATYMLAHVVARLEGAEVEEAYVSIRQHTSAYVSRHTCWRTLSPDWRERRLRKHTSAYVSIRQHTSAYVSRHTCWRTLSPDWRERRLRKLSYLDMYDKYEDMYDKYEDMYDKYADMYDKYGDARYMAA
jgi:hypothetical protein